MSKKCRVSPLEEDPNACVGCFVANNRCTHGASSENGDEIRCSKCLVEKDFSKCTCTSLCKEEDLNEVLLQMPGRDPLCSLPHAKIKTDSILRNSDFATCKCEAPCSDRISIFSVSIPRRKSLDHIHTNILTGDGCTLCSALCVMRRRKSVQISRAKIRIKLKDQALGPYGCGGLIVGIPWCEIAVLISYHEVVMGNTLQSETQ